MSVVDQIHEALKKDLNPVRLEVVDNSHLHAGHSGARPGGETHFHVTIVSDLFTGQPRVARHRRVNKILAALLETKVHALQLTVLTESEDQAG